MAWIAPTFLRGVVCCQGALAACGAASQPDRPAAPAHELIVEGVEVERWAGGERRLRASAASAELDRREGKVSARGVEIVTTDASGRETGRVSADALEADARGARAELSGRVTLRDPLGRVATATYAVWTRAEDRLEVPGPVLLRGANFELTGRSLSVALDAETATIAGPVRARVQPR